MLYRSPRAFLLVMFAIAFIQAPVSRQRAARSYVAADEPTLTLPVLLGRLGKKCDCVFTIEEAWTEGESVGPMEGTFVPEAVLQQNPQEVMDRLRGIVPNLTYETDKIDSRIINIKDKRLLQLKTYAIDQ